MIRALVLLASLSTIAHAQKREVGQLVYDGVPEVPKRIGERAQQYQAARGAAFLDWDSGGRYADRHPLRRHLAGPPRRAPGRRSAAAHLPARAGHRGARSQGPRRPRLLLPHGSGRRRILPVLLVRARDRRGPAGHRRALALRVVPALERGQPLRLGVDQPRRQELRHLRARGLRRPAPCGALRTCEGQWTPARLVGRRREAAAPHYVSIERVVPLRARSRRPAESTPINAQPGNKISLRARRCFARKGPSIYYTSDEDASSCRLVRLDLASGKKEVVSPATSLGRREFRHLADGRRLAFVINEGGARELYLAPHGRAEQDSRASSCPPAWLPPG